MQLAFIHPTPGRAADYEPALAARIPGLRLHTWPAIADPRAIEVALVWMPPAGSLAGLSRLRLVINLGMGVDHLMRLPDLPPEVPVVRLVDRNMVDQMTEYALCAGLYFHRHFNGYDALQRDRRWQDLPLPHTARRRIGVLGMGQVGTSVAQAFSRLGFDVAGWSQTTKSIDRVASFAGADALLPFLARTDIAVCTLPLTDQTRDLFNTRTLAAMPRGAYLVNIARGAHVVEDDLLAALDAGQLAGAMLDVVRTEPLPASHRLWTHPRLRITPHIAGLTNPETACAEIAENIRRLYAGETLLNVVEFKRGY